MIPENPSGYNPNIPQPFDIPAQTSQPGFLTDFGTLNQYYGVDHVPFGNTITAVVSTPGLTTFTSPAHGLAGTETIVFSHLAGITGIPVPVITPWTINGIPYTGPVFLVVDANTFTVAVDTRSQQPYQANSGDFTITSGGFPYGYHKKLSFNAPIITPSIPPTSEAIYTKLFRQLPTNPFTPELDFLNILGEMMLSNAFIVEKTPFGQGFKTPWGITVNLGMVNVPNNKQFTQSLTVVFPIPYVNPPLTIKLETSGQFFVGFFVSAVTNNSFNLKGALIVLEDTLVPVYYIAIGR